MESSLKLSQGFIGPRTTVTHTSLQKVSVSPFPKDGFESSKNNPSLDEINVFSVMFKISFIRQFTVLQFYKGSKL